MDCNLRENILDDLYDLPTSFLDYEWNSDSVFVWIESEKIFAETSLSKKEASNMYVFHKEFFVNKTKKIYLFLQTSNVSSSCKEFFPG